MSSLYDFLNTELSSSATGGVNAAEGQDPSTVNDGIRQFKQLVAAFIDDLGAVNTVGGTGDAVTVTLGQVGGANSITAYATGQLFRFIAGAANTGAATMNVNSIGAKAIRKISGGTDVALSAGDIAAGETYLVIYRASANAAAGAWVLVGGAAIAAATTSAAGIVELANLAETLAFTDATRAVTPSNIPYGTGHISPSLTIANNGSDASNDIDVSAFTARDASDSYNLVCAARTKQIDAAWAVGTNQGGLDTGSVANTTYYIWGILRSDTRVADVLFSTSNSAPTMPSNYDAKVLIGEFTRTGGANGIPIVYGNPLVRLSGAAPTFACRAWVNFNGTGTVAIRGSGNVSSITDNNTGDYTVNFTTAMPDGNYAAVASAVVSTGAIAVTAAPRTSAPSTTAFRLATFTSGFGAADAEYVSAAFFR